MRVINYFSKVLSVDKAIINSILKGGWISFSGIISMIIISKSLSSYEVGYYYTFLSLITAQSFIEMGLLVAISQNVSHQIYNFNSDGIKAKIASANLYSLLKFSVVWFFCGAVIFALVMCNFGAFFFRGAEAFAVSRNYSIIWNIFVIFSALQLLLLPFQAFIEGANNIADVALMKLNQSFLSCLIFWAGVYLTGELYFVVVVPLITFLVATVWMWRRHYSFFEKIYRAKVVASDFNWVKDLLPFQWRLSISWIAGFFIFNFLTPMIFKYSGPEQAGQFGLTLQLINIVGSGSLVWVSTKFPMFGILISKGSFLELNHLFMRQFRSSLFVFFASAIFLIGLIFIVVQIWPTTRVRMVDDFSFVFLILAALSNHVIFCISFYLRAFKREPLMVVSLLNAFATVFLAFFLIPDYGIEGAALSYALSNILVGLPGSLVIFRNLWKRNSN